MRVRSVSVFLLVLSLLSTTASASDTSSPVFHFNGFATLGVVHSDEDRADFRNSLTQPDGAGHSHDWALGVDSRAAAQVTADFSDKLTAVVQVIVEQRYDDSYTPRIEWANIRYNVTPDFNVRAGRIVLPSFMVSEYRKVGYANPWVRPPIEVYDLVPVTSNDGVDASYRFRLGVVANTLQAYYGRRDFDVPGAGEFQARDSFGVFNTMEFGDATLRGGYQQARMSAATVNVFFDQFRRFGAAGDTIADRYSVDDKLIKLWTVGGAYDPGDWFVRTEWARTQTRAFRGTLMGWYATGGYRFGAFTPYIGFAQRRKLSSATDPGLNVASLPPILQGPAAGLNAGLDTFIRANEFDTLSIGARWDFIGNASLKLQVDRIRLDDDSQGPLANIQPGFRRGGNVNVFSATLDIVF